MTVNFEMSFWCFQFQKNKNNATWGIIVNFIFSQKATKIDKIFTVTIFVAFLENTIFSRVKLIRSFFGRNHGLTICFRVLLTFSNLVEIGLNDPPPAPQSPTVLNSSQSESYIDYLLLVQGSGIDVSSDKYAYKIEPFITAYRWKVKVWSFVHIEYG